MLLSASLYSIYIYYNIYNRLSILTRLTNTTSISRITIGNIFYCRKIIVIVYYYNYSISLCYSQIGLLLVFVIVCTFILCLSVCV